LQWSGTPDGLESVKKTPQVASVGMGPSKSAVIELARIDLARIDLARIDLGTDIAARGVIRRRFNQTWISH
jgi:hypothetical protein